MGMTPAKFEFEHEGWTVKATVHFGTTPARGDDPTVLLNCRVFDDDKDVTDSLDIDFMVGFEHLALEYAYDNKEAITCREG